MAARNEATPPKRKTTSESIFLIVCPACGYGFPAAGASAEADDQFSCPRSECGHKWLADTKTVRAVHGDQRRTAIPELLVIAGERPIALELPEGETVIGRDSSCGFVLENLSVSRRHARLIREVEKVWIEDLGSSSGTLLNRQPTRTRTRLTANDTLVIGGVTLRYVVRFTAQPTNEKIVDNPNYLARKARSSPKMEGSAIEAIPLTQARLTFGRASDRDVVLPDPMISRRHAVLDLHDGAYFLSDAQSRIGTFVNGKSIIRARLESGDRIQLGPYLVHFNGTQLSRVLQPSSLAVVAVGIRQKAGTVQLLDGVNLVFQPGEFVGLLGPSGAGKTTLLDALNGLRPAQEGAVYINGAPLYEQYDRLRHLIGYVPQDDIIHRELTSRQALFYAGKLRLPPDTTNEELQKLVEETLAALDLTARGDVPISKLSGGQRKRVSVGVELLNKPGILFLDEPTSGLDPSTESRLMRKFKQLASQGRTVVCTTHVMENIDLFDKVAVLAPGGKLAFFGPPSEAKSYFGIEKFTILYDRLEEKTADTWKHEYAKSPLHAELLAPALKTESAKKRRRHRIAPASPFSAPTQWLILTRRYMSILGSDRQNLILLAAQPLLIAWLICQVCTDLPQILFLLVVSGIWFGCSNAAQQIVKERTIYRRERMVNLRLDCYILSKFLPLAAICFVQCGLMLWIISLFHDLRGNPLVMFAAPLLASWNGVAMGLIISAFAANPDKAMFVVPVTLLPQIILGGVLVALPSMSTTMQVGSCLAVSRWANQAIEVTLLDGRTIDQELLNDDAYIRPLWNLYPADDLRKEEGRRQFLQDHAGSEVRKSSRLVVAFAVLSGLLLLQLMLVALILCRQDAF